MPRLGRLWYREKDKPPVEVDFLYLADEQTYYYQRLDNRQMSQPFKSSQEATIALNSGKLKWVN